MTEHASSEAEDDSAPRGGGRPYAVAILGLALLAGAVGLGLVVGSWPAPPPPPDPQPGAVRSDYAIAPASPTRRQPLELPPGFRGRTVAEASAAAEAAGGTPVIFDARWNRPVKPDWVVCSSVEALLGDDSPSGDFDIAAVPAGDPCP
jgi:hypothetical protein